MLNASHVKDSSSHSNQKIENNRKYTENNTYAYLYHRQLVTLEHLPLAKKKITEIFIAIIQRQCEYMWVDGAWPTSH